jgi:hypothetical protein
MSERIIVEIPKDFLVNGSCVLSIPIPKKQHPKIVNHLVRTITVTGLTVIPDEHPADFNNLQGESK